MGTTAAAAHATAQPLKRKGHCKQQGRGNREQAQSHQGRPFTCASSLLHAPSTLQRLSCCCMLLLQPRYSSNRELHRQTCQESGSPKEHRKPRSTGVERQPRNLGA